MTKSMVSILIPTARRPELLTQALRSVAEQSALSEVCEIIVSESAGDPHSGDVCRTFPDLPIKYILRNPQLQMTEHFSALKKAKWEGAYTATLHDDDWWAPDFLRHAIDALTTHPQASAYCCSNYLMSRENSLLETNGIIYSWFGANYPRFQAVWDLSSQDVLLACLLNTPAQYSTIVARAEDLREAASVFDTGNWWDGDRMILSELSRRGSVLYSPLPKVFSRRHSNQLTQAFTLEKRQRRSELTTQWLIDQAGETWQSASRLFCERVKGCPPEDLEKLYCVAMNPWCLPLLVHHAEPQSDAAKLYQTIQGPAGKRSLKKLIPPLLLDLRQALSRKR